MAHDRDHEHHLPAAPVPVPAPLQSRDCPDRTRREHPTPVPKEPVDPRVHPKRRHWAVPRIRPA